MKQTVFTGSAAAMVTPFTPDGRAIEFGLFRSLCEAQIKSGTDALVIAGTTGEASTLSLEEKSELFANAVQIANGRVPVIAGAGSNNTETAVRNANAAEKQGVNAILAVTPYYNKCTQEGLIKHYYYIADRVSVPVIVYNVPSRTGVNIEPQTYKALSEHKNIAAAKEANGNISALAESISLCGNDLAFYSGNDDQTAAFRALGANGVISVAANIIPKEMHEMCACNENGVKKQLEYLKLIKALFCEVNPIPVKASLEIMLHKRFPLRLPLTRITPKNREILKKTLAFYNMI